MFRSTFLAACLCAGAAHAQDAPITVRYDGSFEDATFALESAILDRGLVIDYTSHVGDMLNRTGTDVGSETRIFEQADIMLFCSAVLSREMMEADPMNISHCPYGIFVADTGDAVVMGYRSYPAGPMQKVQTLLSEIVAEATAF